MEKQNGFLCWDCRSQVELIKKPYCEKCGDPVEGVVMHQYCCSSCCDDPPAFLLARSAFRYRGVAKKVIQAFKYYNMIGLTAELVDYLRALWEINCSGIAADAVVGVPLFPGKERRRGYNQSFLLGKGLASRLNIEFDATRLRRIKDTGTQTNLSAVERRRNVKDAFVVREDKWTDGRFFILVDDVMTTGATVRACSLALMRAGAKGVVVLTLARG